MKNRDQIINFNQFSFNKKIQILPRLKIIDINKITARPFISYNNFFEKFIIMKNKNQNFQRGKQNKTKSDTEII